MKFYSQIWKQELFWRLYRRAAMNSYIRISNSQQRMSLIDALRDERKKLR